jgi:predicted methyltransferase
MFNLAGELYATDFYRQLWRVLRPSGRIFHYIGNPASKSGRGVTRGAIRRLHEAGFSRVKPYPRAFGIVAYK